MEISELFEKSLDYSPLISYNKWRGETLVGT